MIGRRMLLGGFMAGMAAVARPAWAEAPSVVPRPKRRPEPGEDRALNRLIEAAKLSGALAYVVADRATGRVLASKDANLTLPPASVAKAITSLYALEQLGPTFRFRTRLMRQGPVVNGRLAGDLYLVGGGDPNLDTDDLGDLAAALAATGLRAVSGRFIACDGALPAHTRIAADQPDHLGYNPAISGLNLNYNRVHFEWKPAGQSWQLAMDARGARFVPPVAGVKVALASREAPIFAYEGSDPIEHWTVAEPALGEAGSRWLPVRRPAPYVAEVFATLAAAHGLTLPRAEIMSQPPADAVEIVAHEGEELTAVLADMLRFSTNLTAEAVGLMASGAGSLTGSGAAMSDWARRRFGMAARFVDHSGLGVQSAITAEDLVKVMLRADAARHGDLLAGLMREKGLADDEGKELKSNPVRIQAKSGTLNFVSNLAGYVTAPGGELAFAIIVADPARRAAVPMDEREQPAGGRSWTRRARRLHHQMIRAWSEAYL
jgi:D-alanyl-D-alanine carboxypeptidase/D-alanyl-D-alanine-endopeptidase (penicillin-binding protein 4)